VVKPRERGGTSTRSALISSITSPPPKREEKKREKRGREEEWKKECRAAPTVRSGPRERGERGKRGREALVYLFFSYREVEKKRRGKETRFSWRGG